MISPILACASVPEAIEYYTQKLDFELAWSMPASDGQTEFACVKLADMEILLGVTEGFVEAEDMDKRGTGIQIYINLPESVRIETIYEIAKARGAKITRDLETREWGEKAFTVDDLDGYDLMFAQQPSKIK